MKLCFMFINRDDCKKVEQHLSKQFKAERDSYLGYDTIYVQKEDYRSAVTEGLKFINSNDIRTAWWIDSDNQRMPTGIIPLIFAELPHVFKKYSLFRKAADLLCSQYSHTYSKLLGVPVLFEPTAAGNVEFHLVRCHEVADNHARYAQEIIDYCKNHRHIFSYIAVCDAYGGTTTIINKDLSVA